MMSTSNTAKSGWETTVILIVLLWFHGKPGSCVFIWLRGSNFSIIQVFHVIDAEKPSGWEEPPQGPRANQAFIGKRMKTSALYWLFSVTTITNSRWMSAIKEIHPSLPTSLHLLGVSSRVCVSPSDIILPADNIMPLLWKFEIGCCLGPTQQGWPLVRCRLAATFLCSIAIPPWLGCQNDKSAHVSGFA